jgi:hypothetical protein
VAGVLPVVGYSLLRPHVGSDAVALAAVMVVPVAEIAFEHLRFLEISPVLNWGVIGALLWYTTVSVRAGERQALVAADAQSVVAPPGVRGDR